MAATTVISLITLLLALVLTAVFLFYKKCFRYWDNLGIIHTKPRFPLGDVTRSLTHRQNMGEAITHVYSQFRDQPFVGFWLLFRPALLIRDPELVKDVLVRDFMSCHDRGIYVNEKKEPLTGTLFMISGQKWKNLRVKLTPTFTSGKMKMMFPIMEGCANLFTAALEDELADKEIVEMKEWSARYTTDVISLCAFGIDSNSLKNPEAEFRRNGAKMLAPTVNNIIRLMINFLAPDLVRLFQVRAFDTDASNYFLNAVRETMDYRENTQTKRNDFMDLLVQLRKGKLEDENSEKKSDGITITVEEAAAQAFAFFIAGFETSSTTMIFTFYELAKNPDIQNKLREEIDMVLKSNGGVISYDCVASMELLGRVVNESLRLYPVVPFLQRETSKDYQLSGTEKKLPKGTQIMIDVLGIHRDPVHYPEPEKFDPDRFLEEEKAKRHNYTFLPFGEGPRNCIGMRFGLMQVKLGIMVMVQNFEFSVCSKTPIPMKIDHRSFIMTPDGGMHLKVTKVNRAGTA